jgi:integrase
MCRHLNRTGAMYYFRRPVPKDLIGFFLTATGNPRTVWKFSLGVTERETAKSLLLPLQLETEALIAEARAGRSLGVQSAAEASTLSEREQEEQEARAAMEAAKKARHEERRPYRVALRRRMMLSTAELTPEEAAWRDLVREATDTETVAQAATAQQTTNDALAVSMGKVPTNGRTVEKLIEAYEADKSPGWSGSSKKAVVPVFRLLRDVFPDRGLASITREDARAVVKLLEDLPTQIGKRSQLQGLTIRRAIEKGREMGLPTIRPKTINDGYIIHIAAMWNWAVKEQWLASSPFIGLAVYDPVHNAERRDPFTPSQLMTLFSGAPWAAPWKAGEEKPGAYWVPLLCLFLGLRNGEAAGLRVEDIGEDHGIPVLRVRAYDDRSLKNKEARGTLPLHPELIRLGFLAHVAHRRDAREVLLFPEGVANSRGQVGAKLGERFSAHVKRLEFVGTKLGTHSFRHCFEDRLRAAELAERTALALARRAEAGSSGGYGHGLSARQKAEAVAKISYPGLDLSHLYAAGVDA